MRGLGNILFKDRLEQAVGVIASFSGDSLTPGENFLSLANLNPKWGPGQQSEDFGPPLSRAPYPTPFLPGRSPLINTN